MIQIYTDGAYSPKRNMGGWAFVVVKDNVKIYSEFFPEPDTTNNRMEMQAIIKALHWANQNGYKDVEIITDSMYVVGSMTMNWKRKKNIDLWEIMDTISGGVNTTWTHVKGHNGNKYNELCDSLAVEATKTIIKND